MAAQVAKRLFTTWDYHRMADAGVLSEDDRVELIDGEIIEMTPIGSSHAGCVNALSDLLRRGLGQSVIVSVQNPVVLSPHSEPQPDICLLRPRADFYRSQHPGPSAVLLLVEVADSSKEYDRALKLPLYARAGIREVWVVDLVDGVIETYRRPALRGYRDTARFTRGQRLAPAAFPGKRFRVSDILG